jgi:membrane-associated phospholipid phosphatase
MLERFRSAGNPLLTVAIVVILLGLPTASRAQDDNCLSQGLQQQGQEQSSQSQDCPTPLSRSLEAIEAYVTAPARWSRTDWAYFGATAAAIGVATHFDASVRTHLVGSAPVSPGAGSPDTFQDALPAAALFAGTWAYAKLIDDDDGVRESHAMLEAAVLSLGTAEAFGYLAGRQRPDQTLGPGHWRAGGSSFPSGHVAAAFAIGTVLAESGNYRWVRRAVGYGVAAFTAYERLKHNAHWLSDTVAGAALGAASARFAMDREHNSDRHGTLALEPMYRGIMLTYTVNLR